MNKFKRNIHIIFGLLQFLVGCALVFVGVYFAYQWTFKNTTADFFPQIFQRLMQQFGAEQAIISTTVFPVLIAVVGLIFLLLSTKLMKKPINLNKEIYIQNTFVSFLSAVLNASCAYLCFWLLFDIEGFKTASIIGIVVFGIIAFFEVISTFLRHGSGEEKERQAKQKATQKKFENPSSENHVFVSKKDFEDRINQLIKLIRRKKISEAEFVNCASGLFSLPVEAPIEFKIDFVKQLNGKKYINSAVAMVFYGDALSSPSTTKLQTKIKYLEKMHKKGIFDDETYANVLKKMMTSVY